MVQGAEHPEGYLGAPFPENVKVQYGIQGYTKQAEPNINFKPYRFNRKTGDTPANDKYQ
jgi:hypothetical protein